MVQHRPSPTAVKSKASPPAEGAPAGPTSDAFDYGKEMEGVVQRVMQAKASAPMGPPPGISESPDRADRERGSVRPHVSPDKPAYTPVKHPELKKVKSEVYKVPQQLQPRSPMSVASTRDNSDGMSASAQRRAYGVRSTMSASTLSMGGSCAPTSATLPDFVFAEPEVGDDDVLMARIGEWIAHRGPTSDQSNGNDEAVKQIWWLAREAELVRSKGQKLKETYDQECAKLEKVKVMQVAKWGTLPDHLRAAKFKELNDWCDDKKIVAHKPVAINESELSDLVTRYDASVKALLQALKGSAGEPELDPECRDLMLELEAKFGEMTTEEVEPAPEMTSPKMNASALALEHVKGLPDGPQKSALFAILQASAPSEVPTPAEEPNVSAAMQRMPEAAADVLSRLDTTQLEEAERVKLLHQKYAGDADAVFTDSGVHFIGPRGRIEDESQHLCRLAHNARMRFNRSFTGASCPEKILEMYKQRKGNKQQLATMFEDFIQSGEDWMQSSLLISMTKSSSQRRKGRHVLMPYADVKKKFGPAIAGQIFTDKRALEASKTPGDATVFFMPHPEAPTQEDWTLLRIWDAMEFEEEQEENVSAQLRATGEFDEKASKEVLQSAMGTEIDKLKAFSFGAGSSGDPSVTIPEQPQKKQKPMSKKLSSTISQCSAKMTEVVSWEAKIKENKAGLTNVLMEGFSRELATRLESVKSVRVELESLYSKRVEDSAIDQPDNSDFKERCMVALRNAESAFTNFAGTVRSIKSVVEPASAKPKSKSKAKAKAPEDEKPAE